MSLVENIARRNPSSSETMAHVAMLRGRGYSDADIAAKIGCTASWANNIGNLLDKGEGRLLTAIEAGHMPLHLAVSISRATDEESQLLLLEAYNRGDLKGKKLSVARRILQLRQTNRRIKSEWPGGPSQSVVKKMTPEDLVKLYQRHTAEHRRIQERSEQAQQMLLLAQEIFKELFGKPEFLQLLSGEGLATVPQPLAAAVGRKGVTG